MMKSRYFKALLSGSIFVILILFPRPASALTVNPRLELESNPGKVLNTTVKVTNEERQTKTLYLLAQNFNALDETGSPSFSNRAEDLATWIKTPPSITLGPLESIEMPIQINIPQNAEPGGHYSALFFLSEPPNPNDSGQVALASKLGTLILLRVNGNFIQNANVLEFGTTGKQHVFTTLPVQFYYRFQNTGADHLKPLGDIQIKNIFGGLSKVLNANPTEGSVLPQSVRRFISSWTDYGGPKEQAPVVEIPKAEHMSYWDSVKFQASHFAIGRYTANLKVVFGTKEKKSDHAELVFYIIPWQLLSIAIPVLIILLWILKRFLKRYNRYVVARAKSRE